MGCRAVVFVYIFVAIIQGLIWGFIAQIISENKGYEDGFFWGFFLGIIGLIVVACKPDNNSSYDSALLSKAAEACILIPVKTTDIWNSARCSALMTSTLLAY